eukprot:UN12766
MRTTDVDARVPISRAVNRHRFAKSRRRTQSSILSTINTSRKLRGYVDCAVLDVGEMSAAEITPAWSVLEKAYADGLVLCVGATKRRFGKRTNSWLTALCLRILWFLKKWTNLLMKYD